MSAQVALVIWQETRHWFAIEASCVAGLHPPRASGEPHHYRISDLLPDVPGSQAPACFTLQLLHPHSPWWLAVGSEPLHCSLPASQLHPLPATLQQARQSALLKAIGWYEQHPLFILDPAQHQLAAV